MSEPMLDLHICPGCGSTEDLIFPKSADHPYDAERAFDCGKCGWSGNDQPVPRVRDLVDPGLGGAYSCNGINLVAVIEALARVGAISVQAMDADDSGAI